MNENPFQSEDEVKFPCVYCENDSEEKTSARTFTFKEDMEITDFKTEDYINDVDFGTFLSVNDLVDDDYVRVYQCQNCGRHIAYLPLSGCRYIP